VGGGRGVADLRDDPRRALARGLGRAPGGLAAIAGFAVVVFTFTWATLVPAVAVAAR